MRKALQYLLLALAVSSVGVLGYYAYVLATDTLSLPFSGQLSQQSNPLRFAVGKPPLGGATTGASLDREALLRSITKGGKAWNPTVSGEGWLTVSGEYAEIGASRWKAGDIIRINADEYNKSKSTAWKLPKDIVTTYTDTPNSMSITKVGLPRELTYRIEIAGRTDIGASDVNWYTGPRDPIFGCTLMQWDSANWKKVSTEISQSFTTTNTSSAIAKLHFDTYPSNTCIIAGAGGYFETLYFPQLGKFTATGEVVDTLSPEYDMKTRIEFIFSSDIYSDTGALYSPEYMAHRDEAKIEFLKRVSVSNGMEPSIDDLELTPNRATLYLPLIEGKKYTIELHGVEDIYGRKVDSSLSITPQSTPFLSLKLQDNHTIWRQGQTIPVELYHIKTAKSAYEIKLCRTNLESFAQMERINALRKKQFSPEAYKILSSDQVSSCTKKTITLSATGMMTPLSVQDIAGEVGVGPGLYFLAFRNLDDIKDLERYVGVKTFSIVDTQLVMKTDNSGKISVLATDINSGAPRSDQSLSIRNNIGSTYSIKWNQGTQSYDRSYTPLASRIFGTGMTLGRTNQGGVFKADTSKTDLANYLYGASNEWLDQEGRYYSYVVSSEGGGHFGYVVSTWNDGITGWNYGFKQSDYSYEMRPLYSTYVHTDRRLYLPGDTVHIKAILRKNANTLDIPVDEAFDINISDPEWNLISTSRVKTNSFGSLATDFVIATGSKLGSYSISILPIDMSKSIMGNSTNFQVEVFKNPTFTADVTVKSNDLGKDGTIKNLKEVKNNNPNTSWYENTYKSYFNIEAVVKARYYNGATLRSVPFTYRIYRSPYYDMSDWDGCFWGCYYSPEPEFYSEGTGSIDSDGVGYVRAPIEFEGYSDDYTYTVETTIRDPLSGEQVTSPGTLLVRMPSDHKMVNMMDSLGITLERRILTAGEALRATFKPGRGKWDASLEGKYRYDIVERTYTVDKKGIAQGHIATAYKTIDTVVGSESLQSGSLSLDTKKLKPGVYILKVQPVTQKGYIPADMAVSEITFYISGDFRSQNQKLTIIPEKTVYHLGEKARVLIQTPYSNGGHLYITKERGGVLSEEYTVFEGSSVTKEYTVDESFYPNIYLGAIAFPRDGSGSTTYSVGYSEIIMDLSDKKLQVDIAPNSAVYKNRDTVTIDLGLKNSKGQGVSGEIEVMVVDESLIRLLGNIDLDVIAKFWKKYPFTVRTALTLIGLENNKFFSRIGSNGGSGDKGGDGSQLSSRTQFKNTAYYNPSILTDASGKARISFTLPDSVTDYRVMAIAQTKTSEFGVGEKTVSVRRDYTLESSAPYIGYSGDTTTIVGTAYNATNRITPVTMTLSVGSGSSTYTKSEDLILNPSERGSREFRFSIDGRWDGVTPYTLTLKEKNTLLDQVTRTFTVPRFSDFTDTKRVAGVAKGDTQVSVPSIGSNTRLDSPVVISLSSTPLKDPARVLSKMISYPYGCVEQTISVTLANAVAIKLSRTLGVDLGIQSGSTNMQDGVAKILRMQTPMGFWKYWEEDSDATIHVSPYVIRSLYELRSLGANIPDTVIQRGLEALALLPPNDDMNIRAEIFASLAQGKHQAASTVGQLINTNALSRHGYLMYAYGRYYLGKYDKTVDTELAKRMSSRDSEYYWYWSNTADQAIYSRLLISLGRKDEATRILTDLTRDLDMGGDYVSTQEKTQILMALTALQDGSKTLPDMVIESGRTKLTIKGGTRTQTLRLTRDQLDTLLGLKFTGNTGSIFYDIQFRDTPIDIKKIEPYSRGEIGVERVFEKIDESKGLDDKGQFIGVEAMKDRVFKQGQLYRVTLRTAIAAPTKPQYFLNLEDSLPGGWRPLRGIFKTESSAIATQQAPQGDDPWYWNYWDHVEVTESRILASRNTIWPYNNSQKQQQFSYTYYIRPEYRGTYILPPVTAYYMYNPERHAVGGYERVIVE